jgi:hypothetical protein
LFAAIVTKKGRDVKKVCSKCKEEKSLDKFYIIKGVQNHGRLRPECKVCTLKSDKRKHKPVPEAPKPPRVVSNPWELLCEDCRPDYKGMTT